MGFSSWIKGVTKTVFNGIANSNPINKLISYGLRGEKVNWKEVASATPNRELSEYFGKDSKYYKLAQKTGIYENAIGATIATAGIAGVAAGVGVAGGIGTAAKYIGTAASLAETGKKVYDEFSGKNDLTEILPSPLEGNNILLYAGAGLLLFSLLKKKKR